VKFWDRFAQAIADQRQTLKGLEGAELEEAEDKLYAKFGRRAQSYSGAIESEGTKWAMAAQFPEGQWFKWTLTPAEHCETCLGRDGGVWQMKNGRLPFYPRDGTTICLFHCKCFWSPMAKPPSGKRKKLGPAGARRRGKRLKKKSEETDMFDWGASAHCAVCGRELTNPESVLRGIGPICAKDAIAIKGGKGSGHHGHAGRPGKVGGSLPGKGAGAKRERLAKDKYGKPKPFTKRPDAIAWLESYGVEIEPKSPESVTLNALNDVAKEVNKIPDKVLDDIEEAKCGMDLVADSGVTAHPKLSYLHDVKPRGWELTPYTWANVSGMGATWSRRNTVITANKLDRRHGSQNLILHEHAHTFDLAQEILHKKRLSNSDEWLRLHKSVKWPSIYLSSSSEESFAESFADYFDSEESRFEMPLKVAVYFEGLFG